MVIKEADMEMTLGEKQRMFTRLVGKLIEYAYAKGYGLTFGEAYRTPEQAARNELAGRGIRDSLHVQRLAVDFNLFKGKRYLTDTDDHRELGEYWESLDPLCKWGGRFGDGNHYSITHEGRK